MQMHWSVRRPWGQRKGPGTAVEYGDQCNLQTVGGPAQRFLQPGGTMGSYWSFGELLQ